jgi:hypothetical protein
MRNKFNEALISAMQRDDNSNEMVAFENESITVGHLDGSTFHFKFAKIEKVRILDLPCIMIFSEHNSPMIFVEYDLEGVLIKPKKGKKFLYKLAKIQDIIETNPKKKKAVKKVKTTKKVVKKKKR